MTSSWNFEAIETHWSIDLYDELDEVTEKTLKKLVQDRIELFESTYSRFRSDSWLSSLSEHSGTFLLPNDAYSLFNLYKELYTLTDGAVNPLIGKVLVQAGYDQNYSLIPSQNIQPALSFSEKVTLTADTITISEPLVFDIGGLGKGYLIDIISELLISKGVTSFCVDAGGDMRHQNNMSLLVGLEHPNNPDQVLGTFALKNTSIAGSAGNRRVWAGFNHIINPKTLQSPDHILAIWVIASSTLLADAMTTALYFSNPEVLLKHYSFEYLIINKDESATGTLIKNPNIELF
jgi:thiamine biosynthesis lipoprotein